MFSHGRDYDLDLTLHTTPLIYCNRQVPHIGQYAREYTVLGTPSPPKPDTVCGFGKCMFGESEVCVCGYSQTWG